jgi:DNA invertase Pin-like site-specific DNA recombinase
LAKPIGATYSRVSNPNDKREASLDTQEEAQVALLESRGFFVPREMRFRERFTGMESIYDRPVLNHIRDLITSGRVQAMSAYDTDRLARDPNELLTVVRDNYKRKVETIFVQCDHATEGRIGEMILYMKGFASALEYDAIRDRTMRGRLDILRSGRWLGGGPVKYGYLFPRDERGRVNADRCRVANPETAPIVRRIFEEIASGNSTHRVADILNAQGVPTPSSYGRHARVGCRWSPRQVGAIVRDRTYIGEAKARMTVAVEGRHASGARRRKRKPPHEHIPLPDSRTEPLVSRELFDRANLMLTASRPPTGRPARNPAYLLRGVAFCGVCGHRLAPATMQCKAYMTGHRYPARYYRCIAHRRKPEVRCRAAHGSGWVEELAWKVLESYILEPGRLERLVEVELKRLDKEDGTGRVAADLKRAEERRRKIDRTVKQLIDAQAEADSKLLVKALKDKLVELDREADELDRHIAGLRLRIESLGERRRAAEATLGLLDRIRARIQEGINDHEEKREIIEMLEARFDVWRDGDNRRVRVRLPFGVHSANSGDSPGRSPRP